MVPPAGSCSSRPGCCLQNSPRHGWSPGPHCSIPVRTWKASPSPRVACWKGRDRPSEHGLPEDKNPPAPTRWGRCRAARAWFCPSGATQVPGGENNASGCSSPSAVAPPALPPAVSDGDEPPVTLLISLCLSLLTISSRTSPSPLISLEDKDRPMSCDSYCFRPSLCKTPSLFYLFMH